MKSEFDYSLIHSHGFHSGVSAKLISLIMAKPVVHTVHGSSQLDQHKKTFKAYLERFALVQINYDRLITVTRNFLQHQPHTREVAVIPNGVDVNTFDQVNTKKHKHICLIFVGRDDPVKALDLLETAVERLKEEYPELVLHKIIDGNLRLRELARKYKQAHLFVLPSLSEGQPLTLLEAWAGKLPVVVTSVGENPYMVKDGLNGKLVEPNNLESLQQALVELIESPTKRIAMGKEGYRLVKNSYTWESSATKTYDVYLDLLASYEKK